MTPERRARAVRGARALSASALALELLAIVALPFDRRAVVPGTLACALLAGASFYAAYEGFDEALRRPR